MTTQERPEARAIVRRTLSWAFVAALCAAALTAVGAIATGDFDETDGRVLGTSLGFAVFSATTAAGASLRFRRSGEMRVLGLATMLLSIAAFLLLLVALWIDDGDSAWRWFGSAALLAFACSHASLVSGALRDTDTPLVRGLGWTSIALGLVDAFFGVLAVSGAVDVVDEGFARLVAVLVVLLLLTTALPPILRRLRRGAAPGSETRAAPESPPRAAASRQAQTQPRLVAEVLAAADRIAELAADPANRASDIQRECAHLREIASSHGR
jgi:peptidoglycan/LPS O-acetylase OafA/YrhL